jgi:hypothetical protein
MFFMPCQITKIITTFTDSLLMTMGVRLCGYFITWVDITY